MFDAGARASHSETRHKIEVNVTSCSSVHSIHKSFKLADFI